MVDVYGTTVTVTYRENGEQYDTEISQDIPYEYVDDLIGKLEEAKQEGTIDDYTYTKPFDWSMLLQILIIGGSAVLVVMIFLNLNRQSKDGNSVFSFGNSRARVMDPNKKDKVTFKDVAGSIEEKEELSEIVDFLKNPKKYQLLGAKIRRASCFTARREQERLCSQGR